MCVMCTCMPLDRLKQEMTIMTRNDRPEFGSLARAAADKSRMETFFMGEIAFTVPGGIPHNVTNTDVHSFATTLCTSTHHNQL